MLLEEVSQIFEFYKDSDYNIFYVSDGEEKLSSTEMAILVMIARHFESLEAFEGSDNDLKKSMAKKSKNRRHINWSKLDDLENVRSKLDEEDFYFSEKSILNYLNYADYRSSIKVEPKKSEIDYQKLLKITYELEEDEEIATNGFNYSEKINIESYLVLDSEQFGLVESLRKGQERELEELVSQGIISESEFEENENTSETDYVTNNFTVFYEEFFTAYETQDSDKNFSEPNASLESRLVEGNIKKHSEDFGIRDYGKKDQKDNSQKNGEIYMESSRDIENINYSITSFEMSASNLFAEGNKNSTFKNPKSSTSDNGFEINFYEVLEISEPMKLENSVIDPTINSSEELGKVYVFHEEVLNEEKLVSLDNGHQISENETSYMSDRAVYLEGNDLSSEFDVQPCLNINFNPVKNDDGTYSIVEGGLEISVGRGEMASNAFFGVRDKNDRRDIGSTYQTSGNSLSAILFKEFENRGVFLDVERDGEDIYLRDISGARIAIEDNENVGIKGMSYDIFVRNKDTGKKTKVNNLEMDLDPGNYVVDIVARVENTIRTVRKYNLDEVNSNRGSAPKFSQLYGKDGSEIRAYSMEGLKFKTDGRSQLLDQMVAASRSGGAEIELATMNTVASNNFLGEDRTYIRSIKGAVDQYLKLNPTADKEKVGLLYLVKKNDEIIGELGYGKAGLEYVAREGYEVVPIVYEPGVDVKGARTRNKDVAV